jgi:hypothetical protein
VTAGLTAVTHDGRGNTVAIGSAGYTYTADNRLATGGGSNFYHDMLGRIAHSSGAGLNFLYDIGGGQLISEQGSSGVTAVHVQGPRRRRAADDLGTEQRRAHPTPRRRARQHHRDERRRRQRHRDQPL